jgi:hypothetical protein
VRYHGPTAGAGSRNCITISASSGECTITGCTLSGTYSATEGSRGIRQTAECTLTVSSTTITGGVYGFLIGSGVSGDAILDSCTISNVNDGITCEAGSNITITNCTIHAFQHGAVQVGGSGATGLVHHNTVYFSGSLAHNNGYIAETGATVEFYHNVAYGLESASGNGYGFLAQNTGTTATVKNNIAQDCKVGFQHTGGLATIDSDYNDAYGCAVNYSTSPAWGTGANDLEVDPEFTAAGSQDFTLQLTSDCIDAGVAITGINDGYEGAAPDIGRYEVEVETTGVLAVTLAALTLVASGGFPVEAVEGPVVTSRARDLSLTSQARDLTLTSRARDLTLTSVERG